MHVRAASAAASIGASAPEARNAPITPESTSPVPAWSRAPAIPAVTSTGTAVRPGRRRPSSALEQHCRPGSPRASSRAAPMRSGSGGDRRARRSNSPSCGVSTVGAGRSLQEPVDPSLGLRAAERRTARPRRARAGSPRRRRCAWTDRGDRHAAAEPRTEHECARQRSIPASTACFESVGRERRLDDLDAGSPGSPRPPGTPESHHPGTGIASSLAPRAPARLRIPGGIRRRHRPALFHSQGVVVSALGEEAGVRCRRSSRMPVRIDAVGARSRAICDRSPGPARPGPSPSRRPGLERLEGDRRRRPDAGLRLPATPLSASRPEGMSTASTGVPPNGRGAS